MKTPNGTAKFAQTLNQLAGGFCYQVNSHQRLLCKRAAIRKGYFVIEYHGGGSAVVPEGHLCNFTDSKGNLIQYAN